MSLNKVMLIGNVGKDPEVRYLDGNNANGTNTKVASFPLATSERYRDRNGEQHENTEWHNVVVWRGQADTVERFVRKGTQLYVEGRLRTRSWTDQTGAKRFTTEVVADTIQLLGRRQDNPGSQGAGQNYGGSYTGYGAPSQTPYPPQSQPYSGGQSTPATAPSQSGPVDFSAETPGDDLPF